MRRKSFLAAALAGLVALLGGPAVAAIPAGAASRHLTGRAEGTTAAQSADPADALLVGTDPDVPDARDSNSPTWSGWTDVGNKNVQLRYVTANFVVPTVTCSSPDQQVSFWVGLDGLNGSALPVSVNKTVEQAGVAVVCNISTPSGTEPSYYSFWEMYAPGSGHGPHVTEGVSPGDTIAVSVYYSSTTGDYHLALNDSNTATVNFNKTETCPSGNTCHNATAEVIAEDPGGGTAQSIDLAKFGTIKFSEVAVTSRDGTTGTLAGNSLWSANKLTMAVRSTVLAQPSARTDSNTAFTDTWHNAS